MLEGLIEQCVVELVSVYHPGKKVFGYFGNFFFMVDFEFYYKTIQMQRKSTDRKKNYSNVIPNDSSVLMERGFSLRKIKEAEATLNPDLV